MEEVFRIVRLLLVPIPVVLWSLTWPILLPVFYVFLLLRLAGITIINVIKLFFVFFYAAVNDSRESLPSFRKQWMQSYSMAWEFRNELSVQRPYSQIFQWLSSPRSHGGTGKIIAANVFGVVVIASIYSEAVGNAVGILVIGIIILLIWGNS